MTWKRIWTRRKTWMVAAFLGFVAFIVISFRVTTAAYARYRAGMLLREVKALKVGESTYDDALALANRYGWRVWPEEAPCTPEACHMVVTVANGPAIEWWLMPYAEFQVGLGVKQGRLYSIKLELWSNVAVFSTHPAAVMVHEYDRLPERFGQKDPYGYPTPIGKPYLWVIFDKRATPSQREMAYEFNLNCLLNLRGCRSPCKFLPRAFHDWRASVIRDHDWIDLFQRSYPDCP